MNRYDEALEFAIPRCGHHPRSTPQSFAGFVVGFDAADSPLRNAVRAKRQPLPVIWETFKAETGTEQGEGKK